MLCELPTGGDPLLCNPLQVVRIGAHPKKRGTCLVFLADGNVAEVLGTTEQVEKEWVAALCGVGDALMGGVTKALEEMPPPVVNVEAAGAPAGGRGGATRRPRPRRPSPPPEPEPEVEYEEEEEESQYAEPENPVPITPGRGARTRRVRGGRGRSMRAPGTVPEGAAPAAVFDDEDEGPDGLPKPGVCVVPGCGEPSLPGGAVCKDCKPRRVRRLVYQEHVGRIQEAGNLGSLSQSDERFDERHEAHKRDAGARLGDALRQELGGAAGLSQFLRRR